MSSASAITNFVQSIPENKLIFASKLYEEQFAERVTEAAYYQTLRRMCKAGGLHRIGKGTYYRPRKGKYGPVPLPQSEVISAFTKAGNGAVIGYAMYNERRLTTQVPKTVEVVSSKVEQQTKSVGGVLVQFCGLRYTAEVTAALHMLEVLQNYEEIQELNYRQFLQFCKEFSQEYSETAVHQVIAARQYKKKTLAFLQSVLDYYGVANGIGRYLSAFSEYKFPSMEELYEAAQLS